ncbi:molecular chaperone HtpG [Curvivirga aplysinae]|uniref:molecular chaperone HtpG n=1 Tax=Curvivirga aplysinae TaxID=2529852 RepID=UPI0012BC70BF|nr:molecular chaperone HtpG [Curvivirga aplysinae]MTI09399.1 molecular chaperone HtpG [Curvivirga aplysinae]
MTDTHQKTGGETMRFEAEVGRLLDIVANALYSEREIFLRELISNAADACDRLRYDALSDETLLEGNSDFAIQLSFNKEAKTLTIADSGSGMSRDELIGNLGTIARSGTSRFMEKLSGDAKKDTNLIGQFGVGFYSAYMVADWVSVESRRAGEKIGHRWESDGKGEFTIAEIERFARGTTITLHLKDDALEFLEEMRIKHIVSTYSNHIPFPIKLESMKSVGEGDEAKDELSIDQINDGSAIWTKNKSDVTEEQYKEFYHHVSHAYDDPWSTLHFRAEGMIEYSGLIYIPTMRPFDLFNPERMSKLKLYVKRVFITDECDDLLPKHLRFLRGVVDSEDLPLNISREMLQNNPILSKIRAGITKKVMGELEKRAESDTESYNEFWANFGMVLKEGLYEVGNDHQQLLKISRFHSTENDTLVSLSDYVARMKEGQDAIYYIAGEDKDALSRSPQLEGFKAKGVEVLYMTDPVDEFWLPSIGEFDGKQFKSVTRAGSDLSEIKAAPNAEDKTEDKKEAADEDAMGSFIKAVKEALGDTVADVKSTDRLTSSAVCLVADENGMDMNLERLLKQHKQLEQASARIMEVNPTHSLIKSMANAVKGGADITDASLLLLDQARILEGETLPDPTGFAYRMSKFMEKGL